MSMMPMEERPDKWGRLPSQQQRYPVDMNNGNYSPWPQQLPQQQPPQKPKGGGLFGSGKLQTKDIIGMILGTIGDGIAMNNGQRPTAAPMMMQRFQDQREQAAQQEEEQRQYQAAIAAGYKPNEATAMQNGVPLRKEPEVGDFAWFKDPSRTEEELKLFDEFKPVIVQGQYGPVRVPRNRPQIGATVPMDQLGGGAPPSNPAPPPQHRVVASTSQYNELVKQKGKAWTDKYLRDYNVTIED